MYAQIHWIHMQNTDMKTTTVVSLVCETQAEIKSLRSVLGVRESAWALLLDQVIGSDDSSYSQNGEHDTSSD